MSVSRCVHRVSAALARRVGGYIKFPTTDAEMRNVKENFFQVAGFPNVLGAIDGTLVPIKGPSADEHLYICRKGYHALNIQGISDADYKCSQILSLARNGGTTAPIAKHASELSRCSAFGKADSAVFTNLGGV